MDDHMIERIMDEIKQYIYCANLAVKEKGTDIKETADWKAAKILVRAYNKMVKLYYLKEHADMYVTTVSKVYKSMQLEVQFGSSKP